MRRFGIGILLTVLLLAGCSDTLPAQTQEPSAAADTTRYAVYYQPGTNASSVVSVDGRIVLPLDTREKDVVTDENGNLQYIMAQKLETQGAEQNISFSCYNGQGELLSEVGLPACQGTTARAGLINRGAPVEQLRYFCATDSGFAVYNGQADSLLTLPTGDCWTQAVGEGLMFLTYSVEDEQTNEYTQYGELYTLDGVRVATERAYTWSYSSEESKSGCFALAYWQDDQQWYDLFSPDGKLLIRDLRNVSAIYSDRIVCERGFSYGVMDLKGNWIVSESTFGGWED